MYCGDETGSFIGDIGAHTARFGYGGEDAPKYVVPARLTAVEEDKDSSVSDKQKKKHVVPTCCYNPRWATAEIQSALRTVAEPASHTLPRPVTDPCRFLQQGDCIGDWEAYEHMWQTAFDAMAVQDRHKHTTKKKHASGVDSSTVATTAGAGEATCVHPLLAVTPGCTHVVNADAKKQQKELIRLTELMMETFHAPALFVAPTPQLSAFGQGRQTALVVDVGASGCRVTPVVDGLVLQQAQRRNGRGGDWLGNVQWQALWHEKRHVLRPRYVVNSKAALTTNPTPSFHRWAMQDLMYEFRSSHHVAVPKWWYDPTVPFVYDDDQETSSGSGDENNDPAPMVTSPPTPSSSSAAAPEHMYELPDGTLVDLTKRIGKDLCRVPELLFTTSLPYVSEQELEASESSILNQHATLSNEPLHQLVRSSLAAVADVDARKELAGSILLVGGSSVLPNLEQRLSLELTRTVSAAYKCKVLAPRFRLERQCAAWIGGSVLTSLGSFQQLWLSRAEYEEYGATLAIQRFP